MRATWWVVLAIGATALGACGDDADSGSADATIEVAVSPDVPAIVRLRDVTCKRVAGHQLEATGVVSSASEATQYVSLQVRFVDGDGVRVELATDTVSDLQVGESARWDATTYADGAPDVRRCEVTATVS